jgi:hypothetical protein
VTTGSPRRRPPLFICVETQRSKFLNPTVKNRGHFGNLRGSLGNRRRGRCFLSPRFSIPRFRWLRFASKQAPRQRGASVGGFGIRPFVGRIARSFQLIKFNSKGSVAKPREPSSPFHFSDSIFRPGPFVDSRVAKLAQGFKVLEFWSG